ASSVKDRAATLVRMGGSISDCRSACCGQPTRWAGYHAAGICWAKGPPSAVRRAIAGTARRGWADAVTRGRSVPRRYDAVVIGGGHNGLVSAASLARAGRSALVLERRHVLGGAAVTEEVFPGFRFSVASYVVSLLRPEIIRDLQLPRHGLQILPLDGTFTPMPGGNYLWRVNDTAR